MICTHLDISVTEETLVAVLRNIRCWLKMVVDADRCTCGKYVYVIVMLTSLPNSRDAKDMIVCYVVRY
jgi:hypothetical protein